MTQTHTTSEHVQPALPYATPVARTPSPTPAAAVIAFIGLGLIVLGGCFLIPLAVPLLYQTPAPLSGATIPITLILYVLAFTCFGFAAWLLFISVRRLLHVMRG